MPDGANACRHQRDSERTPEPSPVLFGFAFPVCVAIASPSRPILGGLCPRDNAAKREASLTGVFQAPPRAQ